MTETYVTVLRGFPKLDRQRDVVTEENWVRPPRPAQSQPRLWQRATVVVYAGARLGDPPERFGLGAALVVMGRSVLSGCLVVPDDLAQADPGALARIKTWAMAHPLAAAAASAAPWRVAPLSEYFDPYATAERGPAKPWAFQPTAYEGAGFVVGADLGRTFGLVAEHVVEPRGRRSGSWQSVAAGLGRARWRLERAASFAAPALPLYAISSGGLAAQLGAMRQGLGR